MSNLGPRLIRFFDAKRGNKARLAAKAELSHTALGKIARGGTKNPGVLTVEKIERALKVLEEPSASGRGVVDAAEPVEDGVHNPTPSTGEDF